MVTHVHVLAFLLAGLTLAGPLKAQETTDQPAEAEILTAPVKLDGAMLFHVRGVSSLPADMRARLIQDQQHPGDGPTLRRFAPQNPGRL